MRTTDCAQLGLGAERIHLRWISETPASSARSIINHSTAIHNSRSTGEKKVELLVGVWEREGAGWRGRGVYPPPQKSRLSTFPDGRFQCAPRVRTIGIKWLSGFIMMGPARAEFYRAPRKLDLCCDLSWRVHFRFFNGSWDFSRVIFDEASMESKKIWLISILKERWEKKKIIFIKLWFEILANSWFSLAWIFPF